jgi:hypothetical protein
LLEELALDQAQAYQKGGAPSPLFPAKKFEIWALLHARKLDRSYGLKPPSKYLQVWQVSPTVQKGSAGRQSPFAPAWRGSGRESGGPKAAVRKNRKSLSAG